MRGDSISSPLKPFSLYKHNPLFVKLVVLSLLLGLAFRLFSSHSFDYKPSSVLESQSSPAIDSQETGLLTSDEGMISHSSSLSFLDFWVRLFSKILFHKLAFWHSGQTPSFLFVLLTMSSTS